MKIKHIIYTLLILIIGGFIAYRVSSNAAKNGGSKDKEKDQAITVSGFIAKPQTFDNNLSLSGSLEANEQVEIRSEVSGILEKIYFQEGGNVSKGQVLFKVNDLELKPNCLKLHYESWLEILVFRTNIPIFKLPPS